jgi:DNA end-binding protein Ku
MADTKGMAKTSTRSLWKGAITFGLVHIPIGLYSATEESDVNFDWLDRRTMDPVGYKRINKRTGREIDKEDVVKGVQHGKGNYVVLTAEEIAEAYPRTTQTIEIEAFIDVDEVPFVYLEKPYFTAPINKGEKVYALLREAMERSGLSGIGTYVMRDKQHLGCLRVRDGVIVLERMYFADEVRPADEVEVGDASVGKRELEMARQLIDRFAGPFEPDKYEDTYQKRLLEIIEAKRKGQEVHVEPRRDDETPTDLMEALRASVKAAQTRRSAGRNGRGSDDGELSELSKAELEKRAKKAGVRGYSKMKKDELVEALEES